jgi:hypothetical protein
VVLAAMVAATVEVKTVEREWHHGMKGVLAQKFMGKKVSVKISIRQRFCLGYKTRYQVFELTMKATKHI